jgi:YbgC/YbaW family acyl-CoA thioester hydrolase
MPSATLIHRVPFVDVDASQRIHYTAMFRYMEFAEHHLMRSIGMPYATATALHTYGLPRVRLECDFVGAIVYDDVLAIEARVERVGRTSWTLAFTARHAPAGATGVPLGAAGGTQTAPDEVAPTEVALEHPILAAGRMTIVCMDRKTQRATPLPEELRRALSGD